MLLKDNGSQNFRYTLLLDVSVFPAEIREEMVFMPLLGQETILLRECHYYYYYGARILTNYNNNWIVSWEKAAITHFSSEASRLSWRVAGAALGTWLENHHSEIQFHSVGIDDHQLLTFKQRTDPPNTDGSLPIVLAKNEFHVEQGNCAEDHHQRVGDQKGSCHDTVK